MIKIFGLAKPTLLSIYFFMSIPLLLWLTFSTSLVMVEIELFSLGTSMFSFILISDFISISFSMLIAIISSMVLIFGDYYMKEDPFYTRFFWIVFIFVLSMNFLIFIPSLPSLLLGWDGLGISSFVLIIYYQNNKSLGAGVHTLLLNRIGDVLILLSFIFMMSLGHWNISYLWNSPMNLYLIVMITIAAMTKSAQVPFSSWLPAAMAAPTPVSALVHSSTLVTAGIFLLIRFSPFLMQFNIFSDMLMFTAVMTSLLGGWGATYETDLKKIIALSTLSQLGVMMFSLSLGYVYLTLFHLYAHALFKSMLFICAGHILHTSWHNQDIRNLGNSTYNLPFTTMIFNLGNMCLMGIPFMSGFYSKDSILEQMLSGNYNMIMMLLMLFATAFTAKYSLRLSIISLWSKKKISMNSMDLPFQMMVSLLTLSILAIISGKILSYYMIFNQEFIFMPKMMKMIVLMVVSLGMFFAMKDSLYTNKSISFKDFFLNSMWFLPNLMTQPPVMNSMKFSSLIFKSLEHGWLEPLSNSRLQKMFKIPLNNLVTIQESILTKLTTFFFCTIFLSLMFIFIM
uniref:NADH-ubiquinone oxidoreductase chain 5 n=1 Tax=Valvata hokkaidoensis TaxID=96458 RepID=A0A7R7YD00_9GAST|nr:ND5 [Valvata hokkaidoensis]